MGAILLIEDERTVRGLIEKILPKGNVKVIKKSSGYPDRPAESWELKSRRGPDSTAREEIGAGEQGKIYDRVIGKLERALIAIILEEEQGNQVQAAKRLGINCNTLRKKMKDLRIITRVVNRWERKAGCDEHHTRSAIER